MTNLRRFSLDTEFYPHTDMLPRLLHKLGLAAAPVVDSRLISLGIVDVDQPEDTGFYGISTQFNRRVAAHDAWIGEHVLSKLDRNGPWMSRADLLAGMMAYIPKADAPDQTIEFWALNGSYDNYHLCQLFGDMGRLYDRMKEEKGYAKAIFRDLHELRRVAGVVELPAQPLETLHCAIDDALFQAHVIRMLEAKITQQPADAPKAAL